MTEQRAKELLEKLTDLVVEKLELGGAMELFRIVGFSEEELKETGWNCED